MSVDHMFIVTANLQANAADIANNLWWIKHMLALIAGALMSINFLYSIRGGK